MPDHKSIYNKEADNYERLVSREDYERNILREIRKVLPIEGIDVVETGAGTGRLTCLLAPYVHLISAHDISEAMLKVADEKLKSMGLTNWRTGVANHRSLPEHDGVADLVLSGWSICYLVDWTCGDWRTEVGKGLAEMERVSKTGGTVIIIETQGTGFETPHPPEHLLEYLDFLKDHGYKDTWFRTDYQFSSKEEARELTDFFFGKELADQFDSEFLPECTGLWWKKKQGE
jgi:ubiquinone/menaquinone biosynthesis C-methylase UbiE